MIMKLYDDSNITNFTAAVTFCGCDEIGIYVLLDKSFFFPEGGSQCSDIGTIGDATCAMVKEIYHECRHYVDSKLSVGTEYLCKIDKDNRLRNMQYHSGEHIVSGIISKHFGFHNVGFHLGAHEVTCDFDGEFSEKDISFIEEEANRIIRENVMVNIFYPSENELKELSYRSKSEIFGEVRLVEIKGYDLCACCAPHVSQTGEIGIVKVIRRENQKGKTRLYLKCGKEAFLDYESKHAQNEAISSMICVPSDNTADGVKKLVGSVSEKDKKISELSLYIAKLRTNNIAPSDKCILIFEDFATQESMQFMINTISPLSKEICAVFCKCQNGYTFMMKSAFVPLKEFISKAKSRIDIKGGGSNEFAMGQVFESKEKIEEYFSNWRDK